MEKLKAGIFDGPHIRELIKDASFDDSLNPTELSDWLSLKLVCKLPWQPQKSSVPEDG